MIPILAAASLVTFDWDHSKDPLVVGYKFYTGQTSGVYSRSIVLPKTNSVTVPAPPVGVTNYHTVTARNAAGIESLPSNEVRVPSAAPLARGQTFTVLSGQALTFRLPTSDEDTPSSNLLHQLVRPPSRGVLESGLGQVWTYRSTNTIPQDSFAYRVSDGRRTSSVATIVFLIRKP